MDETTLAEAQRLIFLEARLLDERHYDAWLDLFAEGASYWIPSWLTETETASDTATQLSYIYLDRDKLVDYVTRLRSGSAHAMEPTPRTTRLIGNVMLDADAPGDVLSKWIMHVYRPGGAETFSGDLRHSLVTEGGALKIARKKVVLINDTFAFVHMPLV